MERFPSKIKFKKQKSKKIKSIFFFQNTLSDIMFVGELKIILNKNIRA